MSLKKSVGFETFEDISKIHSGEYTGEMEEDLKVWGSRFF